MAIIRKQATANTILSYIGIVLGYVNLVIFFPRMLGADLFGLSQMLISFMMVASNLGSVGLQQVMLRFYPIFNSRKELAPSFQSLMLLIALAGAILTTLVLFVFQDPIQASYAERAASFNDYYYLTYPLCWFGILGLVLDTYSRAIYKTVLTAFFREVLMRIMNLIVVALYGSGTLNEPQFLIAFSAVQGIYALLMLLALIWMKAIRIQWNFRHVTRKLFSDVVRYSGVSMVSVSPLLANNLDVLMVGSLADLRSVAAYTIANAIGKVIMVPGRSMARVAQSVIAEAWHENDLLKIARIYKKSVLTSLIASGIIFLGVLINIDHLLYLVPSEFSSSSLLIIVISVAKIVQVASGINGAIIISSRHYTIGMLSSLSTVVLLVAANVVLIGQMGVIGAAWALLLVQVVTNFSRYLFLKLRYQMEPFTTDVVKVLIIGFTAYVVHLLVPSFSFLADELLEWQWRLMDLFVRSTLSLGVFVIGVYRFRISPDFGKLIDENAARLGIRLRQSNED